MASTRLSPRHRGSAAALLVQEGGGKRRGAAGAGGGRARCATRLCRPAGESDSGESRSGRQLTLSWRPVGSRAGASCPREAAAGETRERERHHCRSAHLQKKIYPSSPRGSTTNGAAPRKKPASFTRIQLHSFIPPIFSFTASKIHSAV